MSASAVPVAGAESSVIAYLPPLFPPERSPQNLVLRVDEARSRYDRGQFVSVAHRLYRGDRRWIPPFSLLRRDALRPERNPLIVGAQLGAFLGIAQNLGLGDEAVGSIAAWSAPAADESETEVWGSWGLFESINVDEMPERLFYEAENWLFEQGAGMVGIRGPLSLEPLTAPGLLTDGFDAYSAAFLPYTLPYYPEMVEAQGYRPGMTWRAYLLDLWSAPDTVISNRGPMSSEAWTGVLGAYSAAAAKGQETDFLMPGLIRWLSQLAADELHFATWPWRSVMGRVFRQALAVVAGLEGRGAAACFGIPDLGAALRVTKGRLLPLGWAPFELALHRTQRFRVFPAAAPEDWDARKLADLYRELAQRAERAGYRQMVIAPVSDQDQRGMEAMSTLHARPTQQFTVYEKRF